MSGNSKAIGSGMKSEAFTISMNSSRSAKYPGYCIGWLWRIAKIYENLAIRVMVSLTERIVSTFIRAETDRIVRVAIIEGKCVHWEEVI